MKITDNLAQIRKEISIAENRFHRDQGSTCLLAVSKTRTSDEIMALFNLGQRHFGENYCQEAIEKIERTEQSDIIWHFIGPIQSNKTKLIGKHFHWVHTVDRMKIAQRLNEARSENSVPLNICVQINISEEESKSGIDIEDTDAFIDELKQFKHLKVRGLMTLPAPTDDFEEQCASFSKLKKKLSVLKQNNPNLDTLSMGTTADMQAAIAEGATIVRIGTAIFGPRNARR